MLKKFSMLAVALAVVALPACGNGDDDTSQSASAESASDQTVPESTAPATTSPATTAPTTTPPATTAPATTTPEEAVTLPNNVLVFTDRELSNATLQQRIDEGEANPEARLSGDIDGQPVTIVKLSGKTNHFGRDENLEYIDYHATVPDTLVWIAEYPETRGLDITTDDSGWWTMYIVKDSGSDLEFSFVFEKDGWVTTKTNVNTIGDEDDVDFAIQFIDPTFFETAMVPLVEGMMQGGDYPDFAFENAMVVTVGKSWASMHDDRLPHGDPGATVSVQPASDGFIGPIYFNKDVIPDLAQTDVSVDGGVVWLNMPQEGTYRVTADKPGVTYPEVEFTFTQADKEAGVVLYIASPPDSLEGDNDSAPGDD